MFGDARPHLSCKSIISGAQYVTAKIFLASEFSYYTIDDEQDCKHPHQLFCPIHMMSYIAC